MSAWLCENKLLSLVVDVVKSETFKKYDIFKEYSEKSKEELMNELHGINSDNLEYLYPDDVEFRTLNDIHYIKQDVSDAQRHKSVCSFIYQSCDVFDEGDNRLFDLLCMWRDDFDGIVDGKEWDMAEWDIDNPLDTIGVY